MALLVAGNRGPGRSLRAQEDLHLLGRREDLDDKVLVVPLKERLSGKVTRRLRREIQKKLESDPSFKMVIFRFETGGGDVDAVKEFAKYVFEGALRSRTTVAWIPDELEEPLGAAVLVAMASKEIILGANAFLAALPHDAKEEDDPRFDQTFRRTLESYALDYRRPTLVARALVSLDEDDLMRVVFRTDGKPNPSRWPEEGGREVAFMSVGDYQRLDPNKKTLELKAKTIVIVRRGEPLRMDATQAREWKVSRHKSASDIRDVLDQLGLLPPEGNVVWLGGGSLRGAGPRGQFVVDFLNHTVVRIVLVVGGCLGLLLELKMMGTMIPGVCGLACFLVLFVSSLFPTTGSGGVPTATYFEIVLFFIGIALLFVELLVIPGVAVFAVSGGALCLISLVLIMVPPGSAAVTDGQMSVKEAIFTLILGFGVGTAAFVALLKSLPRWRSVGQGGVVSSAVIEGVPTADSTLEAQIQTAQLRGKIGVAETPLRPAGKVLLDDGSALDVVSHGEFIERGERVVVTGGSSTRITVARAPGASGNARQEEEKA
ncbi:MAG: hypothetical protein O7J95_05290 [Planctomycetota bacterium]|nr:hypothetical protein [Planctomycetota bacterium]